MISPSPVRLMFDWAQDHRRRLALWLGIALLLHACAYFLFRVAGSVPEPAPALDAAVYVLPPGSKEAARLAPIIEGNDPSFADPERIGPIEVSDPSAPPYQPSYAFASLPLERLPDSKARILPPILRDFGALPVPESRSTRILPAPATDTTIQFGGGLAARQPDTLPEAKFSARPGDNLPPASFLLQIDAQGRVLHVFSGDTTGNRGIDATAAKYLSSLRFPPGDRSAWGTATFHWGADIERKEPQ